MTADTQKSRFAVVSEAASASEQCYQIPPFFGDLRSALDAAEDLADGDPTRTYLVLEVKHRLRRISNEKHLQNTLTTVCGMLERRRPNQEIVKFIFDASNKKPVETR